MTAASAKDLRHDPGPLEPRFAAIYAEHFDRVWIHLRRLGVPHAELDDAAQETFLVAFRRWDDFRPEASWRAWLLGISRRVASRHRRGSGRRLRLVKQAEREPVRATDPHEEVARRHAAALVERFVEDLPPRKREVFILAEIEGLTGEEIARTLAIKPNTVWSRLRGARQAFDRHLEVLRARERGAASRLDRADLLGRCRRARAPERSRQRVQAALVVQLAGRGPAVGWLAVKPVALAIGLGAAGIIAVAGGAHLLGSTGATEARDARVAPATAEPGPSARRGSGEPSASAPSPSPAAPSRSGPAPAAVAPSVSTPSPTSAVEPRSTAVPVPAEALAPPAAPPARASDPPRRGAAPPQSSPDAGRFAEEAALVQAIRRAAQAGDHAGALRRAEDHARRFPGGALARERQALQIAALCRLGRTIEARAEADAWSGAHPRAPLPAGVRRGCEPGPRKKPTKSAAAGQDPGHEH